MPGIYPIFSHSFPLSIELSAQSCRSRAQRENSLRRAVSLTHRLRAARAPHTVSPHVDAATGCWSTVWCGRCAAGVAQGRSRARQDTLAGIQGSRDGIQQGGQHSAHRCPLIEGRTAPCASLPALPQGEQHSAHRCRPMHGGTALCASLSVLCTGGDTSAHRCPSYAQE